MRGQLAYDEKGNLITSQSSYSPQGDERAFTARVSRDFETGYRIMSETRKLFRNRSVIDYADAGEKIFHLYKDASSGDPKDAWKFFGRKPLLRNKVFTIVAHLINAILFPSVTAQNRSQEVDKALSEVAKDLLEWNVENSNYKATFMDVIIGLCVSPVVILHERYQKVFQDIRVRLANGQITTKQAVDKVLSGLQNYRIPANELFISNFHEPDIQKMRFVIRRRFIDYDEAQALYGTHKNWGYVKSNPGVRTFYAPASQAFYDRVDEDMPLYFEELTYYSRREDLEVQFLNGVYFGKPNNKDNQFTHRRLTLASDGAPVSVPIYPFASTVGEPFAIPCFYGMPLIIKHEDDDEGINKMHRMVINGTYLDIMRPIITSGTAKLDRSVVGTPGAVAHLPKDSTVTPIQIGSNLNAGYQAMNDYEKSITLGTQDELRAGVSSGPEKTKYEIERTEINSAIKLGVLGNQIARLIEAYGLLILDDIVLHQTAPEVEAITGELSYATFTLANRISQGKKVSKKIKFDPALLGMKMTKDERDEQNVKMFMEGEKKGEEIVLTNPYAFANAEYKTIVTVEQLLPKNENALKARTMDGYLSFRGDPLVASDPDASFKLLRKVYEVFFGGEADGMLPKVSQGQPLPEGAMVAPPKPSGRSLTEINNANL